MKVLVICGSVIILMIGIQSSMGTSLPDKMATNLLIRDRRDEELQYPADSSLRQKEGPCWGCWLGRDDFYDSGEQDRWPTMEELSHPVSKRRLSSKRGPIVSGPASLEDAQKGYITRRQSLENSLYDLLSTRPRPAPERRTIDNLKDVYMADLLKRHRLPRSPEETRLEQSKEQPISEQQAQNESVGDQNEGP